MKICANYTVFYGEAFLEYSLRSIYPYVDYIQLAIGEKSWKNHENKRFNPIDDVLGVAQRFKRENDPEGKVNIYTGVWDSDTEQRNFLLNRARDIADFAMLVDSDEVWEPDQIKKLIKFIKEDSKTAFPADVYAVAIIHYYRSLYWRYGDIGASVNYVYRIHPDLSHTWIRHAMKDRKDANVVKVPVWYHHFGYAYPSKVVGKKVKFWGHSNEVAKNWYTNVFKKWKPGKLALSPTGQDWTGLKYHEPINIMKDHPLPPEDQLTVYDKTKIACEEYLTKVRGIKAYLLRLEAPGVLDKGWDVYEGHLFAHVTGENLVTLLQLLGDYEGKSDVFNAGDPNTNRMCPDTITWAKEHYPDAELRLTEATSPLYGVEKAKRLLGYTGVPNEL